MEDYIVEVKDISKTYGKKPAIKDVSFKVKKGEILGLVGPNGAGKTTTIKLMLGLQSIDSGEVYLNGKNIKTDFKDAIRKVGAIIENPDHYMYLSGWDNLMLVKNTYKDVTYEDVAAVVKIVKLESRIHDKVKKYSLGMRQRLGIAKAILSKPNLLILDEPTNGLDPEGIKELRELIKTLAKNDMAVIVSSHNLRELETFITDVCIIQNGVIKETTSLKNFKQQSGEITYLFEVDKTKNIKKIYKDATIVDEDTFELTLDQGKLNEILETLIKEKVKIFEVRAKEKSLEDIFLKKIGGNKID